MQAIPFIKVDQFIPSVYDTVMTGITGLDIQPTVSLCHQCYHHIPAYTYHADGKFWMTKKCRVHGASTHLLDPDYEFINSIRSAPKTLKYSVRHSVVIDITDRCNLECPHCYHMPDNKSKDTSIGNIIANIKKTILPNEVITLGGAEASLYKELTPLVRGIHKLYNGRIFVGMLTNGIKFADVELLQECKAAGLLGLQFGLNHPNYLNNDTIRRKQIEGITNSRDHGMTTNVCYTMCSVQELEDILEETTSSDWAAPQYKIRYGADIGRYPDQKPMYISDIFKAAEAWCKRTGKLFELVEADNNLHHITVKINGQTHRLIHWCDITDIHMEELRTGGWCNFVPDGVTNFLHQVIRRDIWKNQGKTLPDAPPARYLKQNVLDRSELDFSKLY
jgi:MoaA/NifB/PqqE/SkfB family radical SAM enzyme